QMVQPAGPWKPCAPSAAGAPPPLDTSGGYLNEGDRGLARLAGPCRCAGPPWPASGEASCGRRRCSAHPGASLFTLSSFSTVRVDLGPSNCVFPIFFGGPEPDAENIVPRFWARIRYLF